MAAGERHRSRWRVKAQTSDTRGALVDGRSRRADGFLLWIETLCQCISDALRIMRHFRDNTVCRMSDRPHVVARSLGRAVRSGRLLLDLAMTTMHRPRSVDCQVLIHSRSLGPRCSSTSVLRLIGGGVGVEGNGEALSA
jgi:hypothetical protein